MKRKSRVLGPDGNPVQIETLTSEIAAAKIGSVRSPISGDQASGLDPVRLANILLSPDSLDLSTEFLKTSLQEGAACWYM